MVKGIFGVGNTIKGFTATESANIKETRSILSSGQFEKLVEAAGKGEAIVITINGRIIQYEPGMPAAGMTMFDENGFIIGREAFASSDELAKTVLHELHRLSTSQSANGVNGVQQHKRLRQRSTLLKEP